MNFIAKKGLILYSLIIVAISSGFYAYITKQLPAFSSKINPLIWFVLGLTALFFALKETQRVKGRVERVQTVFIVVILFLIFYFLSGLLIGYAKTPYSLKFSSIVKNMWMFVFVDIFKTYYRAALVKFSRKTILFYIIITFLFIITDLGIYAYINHSTTPVLIFTNFFQIVFPIVVRNIVLTYLVATSGFLTALTYILPLSLIKIILPIFPDYDWFFIASFEIILAISIYASINYVNIKRNYKFSKKSLKKNSPWSIIIPVTIIAVTVSFMAGLFSYSPLGIMSNSMYPDIKRGDVVIVKKITKENIETIKENDIIKYSNGRHYVVHRVIDIRDNGNGLEFRTKGDYNSAVDVDWVKPEQTHGVVKYIVPKVGFPSVWLSEYFSDTSPTVETK